jgi:hypothetical protein
MLKHYVPRADAVGGRLIHTDRSAPRALSRIALRTFHGDRFCTWASTCFRRSDLRAQLAVPPRRSAASFFYPWLVKSEVLHYGYALVMLAGLWICRPDSPGEGSPLRTTALG